MMTLTLPWAARRLLLHPTGLAQPPATVVPVVTTHLLLLRHGQTDANATGTLQGHLPTPLNRTGAEQALRLAERLTGWRPAIARLVSSDLPRAAETAGPIAAACHLPVTYDAAWRERSFGPLLEGKKIVDRSVWQVAGGEVEPPGAEPTDVFLDRVRQALCHAAGASVAGRRPVPTTAIVTHGGPMRVVLRLLASGRLRLVRGHRPVDVVAIANCSVLHLTARHLRHGIKWQVLAVNDVAHLGDVVTTADAG